MATAISMTSEVIDQSIHGSFLLLLEGHGTLTRMSPRGCRLQSQTRAVGKYTKRTTRGSHITNKSNFRLPAHSLLIEDIATADPGVQLWSQLTFFPKNFLHLRELRVQCDVAEAVIAAMENTILQGNDPLVQL